ncbi:alpha/beta hydrolase [Aspergillus puulaauensis]|uniref:Alpha/beta hydrolase fold-3 domain-containing protein n=1 Tax=Aspergillus puulaauensis TaxID=1220207 RepID=A0A7R8ARF0_9EURO|nr:uncharacterized protein APUU_51539A [Aspergillus puulaauensis]BCS26828.1 hypothetical protein APUU_51539A [Aspergillus puulaauensis]
MAQSVPSAGFSQYQGPFDEWDALIRQAPILDTGPIQGETVEQLQRRTNEIRVKASDNEMNVSGLRERVSWADYSVPTRDGASVPVRVYRAKHSTTAAPIPVYIFFHGGGFLLGNIESENANCARIVDMWEQPPGLMVVHVCTRHTPEYCHPTPFHDAWDAFQWLSANLQSMGGDTAATVIGGISAGAGLAASVALKELEARKAESGPLIQPRGQVLCIPWLIHPAAHPFADKGWSAPQQNKDAPILPLTRIQHFAELMKVEPETDALFNSGLATAGQVTGLSKTSILVAGWDVLRDDGLLYAETLKKAGVDTRVHIFPGLPHGFRRFASLPSSRKWDCLIVQSIAWSLGCSSGVTL